MATINNPMPNPLQTDGFAFVEFATNTPDVIHQHFTKLGFTKTAVGKSHDINLYQQGQILFFVNNNSDKQVREFNKLHGNSASAMGFYVADPKFAYNEAIKNGATPVTDNKDSVWHGIPAICGIGGTNIYFVSRNDEFLNRFSKIADAEIGCGLDVIDHLTHNVYRGNMVKWADFYSKIFGFYQIRYFDIDGKKTGLFSKALTSPCGKIKIPLNESKDDKSQIAEFLDEFGGEGIQHIALTSKNIYNSVIQIKDNGIELLDTPDTYYELIETRLPEHGEDLEQLKKLRILMDGTTSPKRKLLLQIFTQNLLGPAFFEIIQRKGDEGFGEGNFQALYYSIELDQIRRGVI